MPLAVQGTVVTSGSGIGPGGEFGTQGVSGPTGSQGPTGPIGPSGPAGAQGVNSFTTGTSFTVPPVGQPVGVAVADASWMVVGEYLWVDTAGGGTGQAGALQL